jgi:hypothetical protein
MRLQAALALANLGEDHGRALLEATLANQQRSDLHDDIRKALATLGGRARPLASISHPHARDCAL